MKTDKKKIIVRIILAFIVIVVMLNVLDQNSGIIAILKLKKRNSELKKNIIDSMRIKDSLERVLEKLQKDTSYIERIAREKYGMLRSDEKIYKFVEEKKE